MLEAVTYQGMLRDISDNRVKEDIIGILITRPDLEVGKSILCSLNYYHHLTGKKINFICLDMMHIGMEYIRMGKWYPRLMGQSGLIVIKCLLDLLKI